MDKSSLFILIQHPKHYYSKMLIKKLMSKSQILNFTEPKYQGRYMIFHSLLARSTVIFIDFQFYYLSILTPRLENILNKSPLLMYLLKCAWYNLTLVLISNLNHERYIFRILTRIITVFWFHPFTYTNLIIIHTFAWRKGLTENLHHKPTHL